jgi:hypothetical protein
VGIKVKRLVCVNEAANGVLGGRGVKGVNQRLDLFAWLAPFSPYLDDDDAWIARQEGRELLDRVKRCDDLFFRCHLILMVEILSDVTFPRLNNATHCSVAPKYCVFFSSLLEHWPGIDALDVFGQLFS